MKGPTGKQMEVLQAIDACGQRYSAPCMRDIALDLGVSFQAVYDRIRLISKKGFVEQISAKTYRLTARGFKALGKIKQTRIDPAYYIPAHSLRKDFNDG